MMKKMLFWNLWGLFIIFIPLPVVSEEVISILYYDNITENPDYKWLEKGLTDMLITDIASSQEVQVVERENLQKLLKEQNLLLSGLIDESEAVEVGKMLNAKKIIYGSFVVKQEDLRINTKIADAETAKIIDAIQVGGPVGNIFALQKELAGKILKSLGKGMPLGPRHGETSSLEAVQSYYKGIDLYDQGKFEEAVKLFQKANTFDPYYLKPQATSEEAYKFLKDFKKMRYQREINALFRKVNDIKERLSAEKWLTYADLVTAGQQQGRSQEEIDKLTEQKSSYALCNTPAQCVWVLQYTLIDIAGMAEEHFDDVDLAAKMYQEVSRIADNAKTTFKEDPFLPEILYQQLFGFEYFKQWDNLKAACENLMLNFPDFRMMWAIEDFYERAIEHLSEQESS